MDPAPRRSGGAVHPAAPAWPEVDHRTVEAVAGALYGRRWAIASPATAFPARMRGVERRLARRVGREHGVLTCNGSAAIVIALQALGVGPGWRVLVPATTWVGCATAVLRTGATPVFADAGPGSPLVDPDGPLPGEIGAILAVHLFASQLDVRRLRARYPGVPVVEDCSHCQTATDAEGRPLGGGGEIAIMSLQATKLLTCGEGGAAFTDSPELARRMEALRADSRRFRAPAPGSAAVPLEAAEGPHGANFALSEISAALLDDQIGRVADQCRRRAEDARELARRCAEHGVRVVADEASLACGAFHGIVVAPPDGGDRGPLDVEAAIERIEARCGVRCSAVYPPVPESPLYRPGTVPLYAAADAPAGPFPHAARWHRGALVVPHEAFLSASTGAGDLVHALARELAPSRAPRPSPSPSPPSEAPLPPVSVVILTTRPADLPGAVESVRAQSYAGPVTVWVVADGGEVPPLPPGGCVREVSVLEMKHRGRLARLSPVERVARLRNAALELVEGDYVAFLDDDNRWEPEHLASLAAEIRRTGAFAAHSWRRLVEPDGTPHRLHTFPWLEPGPEADFRHRSLVDAGICADGDPVVRDRVSLPGGECGMVDMGEWLFDRRLLGVLRFDTAYSPAERRERVGEDDKLLRRLRELEIPSACTERATLVYRLGGFSNAPLPQPA